jgi:hypothetical protein
MELLGAGKKLLVGGLFIAMMSLLAGCFAYVDHDRHYRRGDYRRDYYRGDYSYRYRHYDRWR